jgi:hypothetical protein
MKAPAEVSAKRDLLAAIVSVNQPWQRGQISALHGYRNLDAEVSPQLRLTYWGFEHA